MKLLAGNKLVEKWKIWFLIPIIIFLVAAIVFGITAGIAKDAGEGIRLGIDFTGGSVITVQVGDVESDVLKEHQNNIEKILKDNNANYSDVQYSGDGDAKSIVYRYKLLSTEVNEKIENSLIDAYGGDKVDMQFIGATASSNLILMAFLSVLISTILILIYIVIRFRNLATAFSAIIALLHDVLIVFAMTVICRIQINASFIAAVITIVAYSINNSIVIFDRIRYNYNNRDKSKAVVYEPLVNSSVSQMLTRCINTSITTLVSIVILAIIGVSSIKEFALPVIFGLVAGTYSSIFVAPSLFCIFKNYGDKIKAKSAKSVKVKKVKKVQPTFEVEK